VATELLEMTPHAERPSHRTRMLHRPGSGITSAALTSLESAAASHRGEARGQVEKIQAVDKRFLSDVRYDVSVGARRADRF